MTDNNICQEQPVETGSKPAEQREPHPIFVPILNAIKGVQVRNATKEKQE